MARKTVGFVELDWRCPNCNTLNPGTQKACTGCGAPQPESVQFEQSTQQDLIIDEAKKAEAQEGADIHCPFCGVRNPAGSEICKNCGGDLIEGKARKQGRVVGAYQAAPAEPVKCPNCGAENTAKARVCVQCGASLIRERTASAPPTPVTPRKIPSWVIIVGALLLVLLCGGLIYFIFLTQKTEASTGIVQQVRWERSIPIETMLPAAHEAWQDELPSEAEDIQCEDKLRSVESEPVPNSVEVCGTPYTVDTGSGFGEVVQDCEYEVYDSYCNYSVLEWQTVDTATSSGEDLAPYWPQPFLAEGQRLADASNENYVIVFKVGDELYTYQTSDLALYEKATLGSEWTLNINKLGSIQSIQP